jgi:RNA polymerase sigma factor (sigma-70 family)
MTAEEALRVLSANASDADAWDALAMEVYQPLVAYVASLLLTFRVAPGDSAHDIVHDVLLGFYHGFSKSRATITSGRALRSYLRVSCRNLLIDRYRRERKARHLLDFLELRFSRAFEDDRELFRSMFLNEVIDMVSTECRCLFNHYVTDDLSLAEIAERLDLPAATFYNKWYGCIQKARYSFEKRKALVKRS